MIVHSVMFLGKYQFRNTCVLNNALIVAENICRTFHGNTKHSQPISHEMIRSGAVRSATNSLPKFYVLTVFYRQLSQIIGEFCANYRTRCGSVASRHSQRGLHPQMHRYLPGGPMALAFAAIIPLLHQHRRMFNLISLFSVLMVKGQ